MIPRKPRRLRTEEQLQIGLAQYLDLVLVPGAVWWHIPNGGKRPTRTDSSGRRYSPEAVRLKAMGVKPGVPDIQIIGPATEDGPGRVVFIELKAGRGKPSEVQERMHSALRATGAHVEVCRSYNEVRDALLRLGLRRMGE